MFELVMLVFLQAYTFKPALFQNDYKDSAAGAIVSDLFIVPSASVVISVFQLGWASILAFSALFMVVEEAFKKLQIFEQYWWRTLYTGISLVFYFRIAKKVWADIHARAPRRFKRFLLLYFCHLSLHSTLFF